MRSRRTRASTLGAPSRTRRGVGSAGGRGAPARKRRGIGSLARRARQPESARGGGWAGGADGANRLGRFISAAKVDALYRLKRLASGGLRLPTPSGPGRTRIGRVTRSHNAGRSL